jgi:hypothetical protein
VARWRRSNSLTTRAQPVDGDNVANGPLSTRSGIDRNAALWPNHAKPRPTRPGVPLTRHVRLDRPDHCPRAAATGLSLTVTPPPHQPTASRSERPSSSVIVRSACPARRSASRTRASSSPSAVSTATAKTSSRRSRSARSCAVPLGHLTLSAAPLALPIADSSHLPCRHRPLSTPAFHSAVSFADDSSGHD